MANDPLFIIAAIASLAVLVILLIGIGALQKAATSTASTRTASCVIASSGRPLPSP